MSMEQRIRFCISPDGTRIAYATAGTGPPLVKVPNWMSHLEFDWHSPVWRHWWTELSRHYTLVRFDLRGCGLSDWNIRVNHGGRCAHLEPRRAGTGQADPVTARRPPGAPPRRLS